MENRIDFYAKDCCRRNKTVRACFENGSMTLDEFLTVQAEKVKKNRRIPPLISPEDFYRESERFAEKKAGKRTAEYIGQAVRSGAVCTADHHGAVFCAQSFQGDMLFSGLLEKLKYFGKVVPILSNGQVELGNSAYARGIAAGTSPEKKLLLPLFAEKYALQMASHSASLNAADLTRFRRNVLNHEQDPVLRTALDEILREVYERDEVLECACFAEQVTVIGQRLTEALFCEEAPVFFYLEIEGLIQNILEEELLLGESILARLLLDEGLRTKLAQVIMPDGTPMADLFFRGADEKGRKIPLTVTGDGFLTGKNRHGKEIRYPISAERLCELLESRLILPGVFSIVLLTMFERGVTWMGGIFQSVYLPQWQESLCRFLAECGLSAEAETILKYDCTTYISGPAFALYQGDGSALPAGPVEMWIRKPEFGHLRGLVKKTTLRDAHRIGLPEIYFDLVPWNERESGWYRAMAEDLFRLFPENIL